MRSEIKGFGTIVREILSEISEDPTYANPTYARFTVVRLPFAVVSSFAICVHKIVITL